MATLVPVLPSTAELRGAGTESLVSGDRGDITDPEPHRAGTLALLFHTHSAWAHSLSSDTLFFLRHTRFALALSLPSPQRAAPLRGRPAPTRPAPPGRGRAPGTAETPAGPRAEPAAWRGRLAPHPRNKLAANNQGTKRKAPRAAPRRGSPRPLPSAGEGAQPCPYPCPCPCPCPLTRRLRRRRSPRAAGPGSGPALPRGFW